MLSRATRMLDSIPNVTTDFIVMIGCTLHLQRFII